MARKAKLGTLRGVSEWQNLDTAGDVKRFLRWIILSMRDRTLESKDAAVMGQIGSYLLKALESSDIEDRMSRIERALAGEVEADDAGKAVTLN